MARPKFTIADELFRDLLKQQRTSKKLTQVELAARLGQPQNLLVAFAKKGKVVYGRAFDVVKLASPVNLSDLSDIERCLQQITIFEIKSSRRKLPPDFSGFFFSLTGAEVLVAQSLRHQF